jgi:hypothetical protein
MSVELLYPCTVGTSISYAGSSSPLYSSKSTKEKVQVASALDEGEIEATSLPGPGSTL